MKNRFVKPSLDLGSVLYWAALAGVLVGIVKKDPLLIVSFFVAMMVVGYLFREKLAELGDVEPLRGCQIGVIRSGVVDATPIELALASALRRRGGHAHIITFSDISWDMSRFDFVIEAYRFTDISSREGDNSYTEVAKFFILDGAGKELNEGTVREVFTGANRPNVVERLAESIARQLEPRRHDGVFTVRIAPERRFAPPRSFTAA